MGSLFSYWQKVKENVSCKTAILLLPFTYQNLVMSLNSLAKLGLKNAHKSPEHKLTRTNAIMQIREKYTNKLQIICWSKKNFKYHKIEADFKFGTEHFVIESFYFELDFLCIKGKVETNLRNAIFLISLVLILKGSSPPSPFNEYWSFSNITIKIIQTKGNWI